MILHHIYCSDQYYYPILTRSTEGTAERETTHCDQIPRWRKRPVR